MSTAGDDWYNCHRAVNNTKFFAKEKHPNLIPMHMYSE